MFRYGIEIFKTNFKVVIFAFISSSTGYSQVFDYRNPPEGAAPENRDHSTDVRLRMCGDQPTPSDPVHLGDPVPFAAQDIYFHDRRPTDIVHAISDGRLFVDGRARINLSHSLAVHRRQTTSWLLYVDRHPCVLVHPDHSRTDRVGFHDGNSVGAHSADGRFVRAILHGIDGCAGIGSGRGQDARDGNVAAEHCPDAPGDV